MRKARLRIPFSFVWPTLIFLFAAAFLAYWLSTLEPSVPLVGDDVHMSADAFAGAVQRQVPHRGYRFNSGIGIYYLLMWTYRLTGVPTLVIFSWASLASLLLFVAAIALFSRRLFGLPPHLIVLSALLFQEIHAEGLYANDAVIAAALTAWAIAALILLRSPRLALATGMLLLVLAALVRCDHMLAFLAAFYIFFTGRGAEQPRRRDYFAIAALCVAAGAVWCVAFWSLGGQISGIIQELRNHARFSLSLADQQVFSLATLLTWVNAVLLAAASAHAMRIRRVKPLIYALVLGIPFGIAYFRWLNSAKYLFITLLIFIPLQAQGLRFIAALPSRLRVCAVILILILSAQYVAQVPWQSFSQLGPGESHLTGAGVRVASGIFFLPEEFKRNREPIREKRSQLFKTLASPDLRWPLCIPFADVWFDLKLSEYVLLEHDFKPVTNNYWQRNAGEPVYFFDYASHRPPGCGTTINEYGWRY